MADDTTAMVTNARRRLRNAMREARATHPSDWFDQESVKGALRQMSAANRVARKRRHRSAEDDARANRRYGPYHPTWEDYRREPTQRVEAEREYGAFYVRRVSEHQFDITAPNGRRFSVRAHTSRHTDPSHHIGTCDEACRAGRRVHFHQVGRVR